MSAVGDHRYAPSGGGRSGFLLPLGAIAVWAAALGVLVGQETLPTFAFAIYGLFSLLAFVAYGADKAAARRGRRRTPEATLHVISVLGGWPGALVAQRVFHHKTVKRSFRAVFWVTVIVNCAVWAGFSLW